ncbi:hypothetical protein D3C78_1424000 [compost metagenome]
MGMIEAIQVKRSSRVGMRDSGAIKWSCSSLTCFCALAQGSRWTFTAYPALVMAATATSPTMPWPLGSLTNVSGGASRICSSISKGSPRALLTTNSGNNRQSLDSALVGAFKTRLLGLMIDTSGMGKWGRHSTRRRREQRDAGRFYVMRRIPRGFATVVYLDTSVCCIGLTECI